MALPIKYNISNVLVRWRTTVATVLGIAAVVAVFVMVNAMSAAMVLSGIAAMLIWTGPETRGRVFK